MEEKKDDKNELNILNLQNDFMLQICEYLNSWDFRELYVAHPKFHDAIHYAVRHKCLVLPLKWTDEAEGYRQIENIKFLMQKFPLELYSLKLNPEIESLENVRRITQQFNENVNQVEEEIHIMDNVPNDDEPEPESLDYFKQIKIDLCEKVHYFAILATTEHLRKMHLLEHVTPCEINYLESLIALSRRHLDVETYYEYMQMCHKLYGLFVLKFIPSVEALDLSQCQLDSKLVEQLKNLPNLACLTLTNVKQTSGLELFFDETAKQNKLESFSLHSKEQNWPSQIICQNLSKMTNLKELHLSVKGIPYETFLNDIAVNLKNISHLEIVTQGEFKWEWILDFLRVADKVRVLELDFNHEQCNWMEFYDQLVQLRASEGNTDKLDVTIFGAAPGFDSTDMDTNELVTLVRTPVVDRE